MKKLIEVTEGQGLEFLLGKKVLLMCGNHHYAGELIGVNIDDVILKRAKIVYETGPWDSLEWKHAESLPGEEWRIRTSFIESYGEVSHD